MKPALILVSFAMAACEVGSVPSNLNTSADAPVGPTIDSAPIVDAIAAALCAPRLVPANTPHIHSTNTTHAGENCVQAGCHLPTNVGTNAPEFQFGGTLYGTDGTTPNGGATIYFSAGGVTKNTTSDSAGNFYLQNDATGLPQPFPATVSVSVCTTGSTGPAPTPMTAAITAVTGGAGGGCAMSGCHTPGTGQGAITLSPTM
jgi:hypothetical protein